MRRQFKTLFRDRDCVTMVRPVEDEKDLQNMNNLVENNIRSKFLDDISNIRSKILKKVKPKIIND